MITRNNTEIDPKSFYTRQRECSGCGKSETVRKDNQSQQCQSCACRAAGKRGNESQKLNVLKIDCGHCGRNVPTIRSAPRKYCSLSCRRAATSILRKCETCEKEFRIARSLLKGNSNSSGRFCSRPCYIHHLCRTGRITGRGSQWNASRKEALRRNPFCALCGTSKKLQVHHAVPFRLTRDNSQENLFPLCVKHHKIVESQFVETEATGLDYETQGVFWQNILSSYQSNIRHILTGLKATHAVTGEAFAP